jgi:hypothetical protein
MRKLPPLAAMSHSLASINNHRAVAFRISWPWFALILVLAVILKYYFPQVQSPLSDNEPPKVFGQSQSSGADGLISLVSLFAFSSIAVNWHRYILINEYPAENGGIRWDNIVFRYVLKSFLIALLLIIAGLIIFFSVGILVAALKYDDHTSANLLTALMGLAGITLFIALNRLSVSLPGVALGRTDFGIKDALIATQGNVFNISGFLILYIIIVLLTATAVAILSVYIFEPLGTVGIVFSTTIDVASQWLITMLGIAVLTTLYGYFVEDREF